MQSSEKVFRFHRTDAVLFSQAVLPTTLEVPKIPTSCKALRAARFLVKTRQKSDMCK